VRVRQSSRCRHPRRCLTPDEPHPSDFVAASRDLARASAGAPENRVLPSASSPVRGTGAGSREMADSRVVAWAFPLSAASVRADFSSARGVPGSSTPSKRASVVEEDERPLDGGHTGLGAVLVVVVAVDVSVEVGAAGAAAVVLAMSMTGGVVPEQPTRTAISETATEHRANRREWTDTFASSFPRARRDSRRRKRCAPGARPSSANAAGTQTSISGLVGIVGWSARRRREAK